MQRKADLTERPSLVYQRIRQILEAARTNVARSVNTTQVIANWLIGREIVEEEQRGKSRARYGEKLILTLSHRLSAEFGRGYSVNNLEHFRAFYLTYPVLLRVPIPHAPRGELASTSAKSSEQIPHAPRGESPEGGTGMSKGRPAKQQQRSDKSGADQLPEIFLAAEISDAARRESWRPGRLHPNLSWTHYRTLLRVDVLETRAFYEIEAIQNNWPARELERQINSLLYGARKRGQGEFHIHWSRNLPYPFFGQTVSCALLLCSLALAG